MVGDGAFGSEAGLMVTFDYNECLLHLLHRSSQIADEKFAAHEELKGLTSRQFIVLAAVQGRSGINQTEITDATGIDRSTLTDLIGRLHSKGLVSRVRSRVDARSYEVSLSDEGIRMLEVAIPIVEEIDQRLLTGLSAANRVELIKALGNLVRLNSSAKFQTS